MNGKPARVSWGRRAAQWAALAAIVIGAAMAGWNGYWYTVGWMAVKRDAPAPSSPPAASLPAERSAQKDAPLGVYLGELAIPKLGAAIPVYEGVREQELRRGVGHYPASDWPGGRGHVVLSGHRDTVFRRFGELEIGDALIIRTDRAAIHYRIVNIRIVDDDDRTVLVEKARPTLTVTTCYPFRLIGRAPKRCIVTARPVRVDALAFPRG
ncbi:MULTISPECIES: class D sortase [Geobacillus]|uniref:Sortase n=5 Tax=Geobacillus TaxID=129337 RepID=U2Y9M8_GEOKU|nr:MULTISPECIES: class D sortase [Geobacillus]AJG38031.1 sortase family protein [Geobacillus sp. enrichment culture clone fosmid MGS-MG1]MED4922870.1 class D sortase [Anoxybacillus geothermalis]AEV20877.1 Sortase [Geobacillus thermoleovorans CCB_US3_UF5]AMV12348.1 sortase [Geobacillus thermoleovorans]AOL35827.1 class D sortase [Geobacillus thermoleovorans]